MSFNKGSGIKGPRAFQTGTPAFNINQKLVNGEFRTNLVRKGTPIQRAAGERLPRIFQDFDELRGTITPGFSKLRQARQARIGATFDARRGTLRDNLSRRRVAGASFAEDAKNRLAAEEALVRGEADAQSFLDELEANITLLGDEFGVLNTELTRELEELKVAGGMASNFAQILNSTLQFERGLAAQEAAGSTALLAAALGFGVSQFGAGGAFAGGGSTAAAGSASSTLASRPSGNLFGSNFIAFT